MSKEFNALHYNVHEKLFKLTAMIKKASGFDLHMSFMKQKNSKGFMSSICQGALSLYGEQCHIPQKLITKVYGPRSKRLLYYREVYQFYLQQPLGSSVKSTICHELHARMTEQLAAPKVSFKYLPLQQRGPYRDSYDRVKKDTSAELQANAPIPPHYIKYRTSSGYVDIEGNIILYPPENPLTWSL